MNRVCGKCYWYGSIHTDKRLQRDLCNAPIPECVDNGDREFVDRNRPAHLCMSYCDAEQPADYRAVAFQLACALDNYMHRYKAKEAQKIANAAMDKARFSGVFGNLAVLPREIMEADIRPEHILPGVMRDVSPRMEKMLKDTADAIDRSGLTSYVFKDMHDLESQRYGGTG